MLSPSFPTAADKTGKTVFENSIGNIGADRWFGKSNLCKRCAKPFVAFDSGIIFFRRFVNIENAARVKEKTRKIGGTAASLNTTAAVRYQRIPITDTGNTRRRINYRSSIIRFDSRPISRVWSPRTRPDPKHNTIAAAARDANRSKFRSRRWAAKRKRAPGNSTTRKRRSNFPRNRNVQHTIARPTRVVLPLKTITFRNGGGVFCFAR